MHTDVDAPSTLYEWPDSLRSLLPRGQLRRFRKGALIIQEGDVGDTIFIVMEGRVKSCSTDDRDREIVYGVYGPGEYLGEMSLDGGPRSASVVALEPTVCTVITRKTLREHIAADPEFAFELLARVIGRARLATRSARNMALLDVYGRLAELLSELSTPRPDGSRVITERMTHAALAARVGCSREMISRLMKDLERGNHLLRQDRRFVLPRPLPARW